MEGLIEIGSYCKNVILSSQSGDTGVAENYWMSLVYETVSTTCLIICFEQCSTWNDQSPINQVKHKNIICLT